MLSGAPEGTDIYRKDEPPSIKIKCDCSSGVHPCPHEAAAIGPGYHLTHIEKGVLGELSKVREELEELFDAEAQGAVIMELCEAADLVGALRAWLAKHHPGVSFPDLVQMADLTERAFRHGRRK